LQDIHGERSAAVAATAGIDEVKNRLGARLPFFPFSEDAQHIRLIVRYVPAGA